MLSRPQRRSRLVGDFAYRFEVSSGGVWRLNPRPRGALGRCPAAPPADGRQGGPTPPPHPRRAPGGDPRGPGIAAAGPRKLARLAALSGSRLQSAGVGSTAPAAEPACRLSDAGSRRRAPPAAACPACVPVRGVPAARLSEREPQRHFHSASLLRALYKLKLPYKT